MQRPNNSPHSVGGADSKVTALRHNSRRSLIRLVLQSMLAGTAAVCLARAAATTDSLIESIENVRQDTGIAAIGLTLVDADNIRWSGAWGVADRATGLRVQPDTMFRIGSVTKSFTALAVLRLAEQGRLNLDTRVLELTSDVPFSNPWASSRPITVAQLLEHTAGFLDISKLEFDNNDPKPLTLSQGLALRPASRVAAWPPGLHSEYSNSGAGIAGYVIEQVTNTRYEEFMSREVFTPLGMKDTNLLKDAETTRRLATGYDTDSHTVIPYWHMVMRPFGAINTTPRDMGAFVQMLLNRGELHGRRIFKATSIDRMEHPATTLAARSGLRYGYGLGNYQWLRDGLLFHGHGGDADGYLAHYGYNRAAGRGYFVVMTAFNKPVLRRIRRLIEAHITAGVIAPEPLQVELSAQQLRRLTGRYALVTERFPGRKPSDHRLTVSLMGGRLYTRIPDRRARELLPVSVWQFRRADEPIATLAFSSHDGALYLQGNVGNYRRVSEPD